jgi:uncharacterized protein YkwD
MIFQGNYIDLIILFVLFIWVIDGWERGVFFILSDLISFVGAFLFGLRFYTRVSHLFIDNFSISRGISNALGFIVVYSIAHSIIGLILVGAIKGIPQKYFPRFWQKFLGIFPALFNGIVMIAVILTLAVGLPIRGDVKEAISESEIGEYLIRKTNVLERSMGTVFGEAIKESLAFITVETETSESIPLGFEVEEPKLEISERLEIAMFALVNHERVAEGVSRLEWDPAVVPIARAHAEDMFERGYFSHVSPEDEDVGNRLDKAGITYLVAGENLAFAPSVDIAHDGLMQSPGHRENILASEFGRVGIGVIDGGTYGKMFVQVFKD